MENVIRIPQPFRILNANHNINDIVGVPSKEEVGRVVLYVYGEMRKRDFVDDGDLPAFFEHISELKRIEFILINRRTFGHSYFETNKRVNLIHDQLNQLNGRIDEIEERIVEIMKELSIRN